jgi:sec-independent protein translocase protein TatB
MFDVGFSELALVCVIALVVLGPERMPVALRTLGLWFGRLRRTFNTMKTEIEREIGMDDIRRQLHNEAVMDEMKRLERDVLGQKSPPPPPAESAHETTAVEPPVNATTEHTTSASNGAQPTVRS